MWAKAQHARSFLDGVACFSISWLWLKVGSHHLCSLERCWTNGASRRDPYWQSRAAVSPCRSTGSSQELLGQLCSLHETGKAWKINLTGPVGLNKPGEAWGCRDGIVMLVPHCSHDYCNRRQRRLLRTSPGFFTAWSLLALPGPRWKWAIHQLGQPPTVKWVFCRKISGVGSLHRALKQHICCMLLSVLSQEPSERKTPCRIRPILAAFQPSLMLWWGLSFVKAVSLADTLSPERVCRDVPTSLIATKTNSVLENLTWIS